MNATTIQIIDSGRGPQLSSRRVTVQDLLPFYRDRAPNDEIRRWIPSLTDDEIELLKTYIDEHFHEVVQLEAEIKRHHDQLRAAQPAWTRATDHLSMADRKRRLHEKVHQRKTEENGAHDSP